MTQASSSALGRLNGAQMGISFVLSDIPLEIKHTGLWRICF